MMNEVTDVWLSSFQDSRIGGHITDSLKGVVVACNKWDLHKRKGVAAKA